MKKSLARAHHYASDLARGVTTDATTRFVRILLRCSSPPVPLISDPFTEDGSTGESSGVYTRARLRVCVGGASKDV